MPAERARIRFLDLRFKSPTWLCEEKRQWN
jgi:hypothetical protein